MFNYSYKDDMTIKCPDSLFLAQVAIFIQLFTFVIHQGVNKIYFAYETSADIINDSFENFFLKTLKG